MKPSLLGRFSALAASTRHLMASAYESGYGDLVLVTTSIDELAGPTRKEVVDGAPLGPSYDRSSYRGGVTDPGDDVGQDSDIVTDADGDPLISYRDQTHRSLKYATRVEGKWLVHAVQAPATPHEVLGRYSSIVVIEGKPAIAYLALNVSAGRGAFRSELRYAAASRASPRSAKDWAISVIDSSPLPCRGLCEQDEACLPLSDGTSACRKIGAGCPPCANDEACVDETCRRVLAADPVAAWPTAVALWPRAVVVRTRPLVLYYDRVQQRLKAAGEKNGKWQIAVIAGSPSHDAGAHCAAAVDALGTVHASFQDARKLTLHYVQIDPVTLETRGAAEVIDDGKRKDGLHPVGAGSAIAIDPAGKVRVLYQDGQSGHLLAVMRAGVNNWAPNLLDDDDLGRLLSGGPRRYGFYTDLVVVAGRVYGSTFHYTPPPGPRGGLEFFALPSP